MDVLMTVIITTHKREPKILKRALDSVYNQTFQDFEIIVVDDAPEYEKHNQILSVVKAYDSRLCYIVNNEIQNACASRNIGIKNAKGKYIGLLDDDDEWISNKLEIMIPILEKSNDTGLVYGLFSIVDAFGREKVHRTKLCEGNLFKQLILDGNFLGGCSVPIFRKSCIEKSGLFDPNLKSAQDYDFYLRMAKEYNIKYVNKVVVRYHITNDAISNSYERKIESEKYILTKYGEDFEKNRAGKIREEKEIIYSMKLAGRTIESKDYYISVNTDVSTRDYFVISVKAFLKVVAIRLGLKKR